MNAGFEHDQLRTNYLSGLGIKVCRIENKRVFENIEGVISEINSYFTTTPTPFVLLRTGPPKLGGELSNSH